MLPVSLEVTSQPLLFCPQMYLDFGVVDVKDAPKTLKLFVINSGNRPVTVQVGVLSCVTAPIAAGAAPHEIESIMSDYKAASLSL